LVLILLLILRNESFRWLGWEHEISNNICAGWAVLALLNTRLNLLVPGSLYGVLGGVLQVAWLVSKISLVVFFTVLLGQQKRVGR
jgi:hypothetical protein